MRANTLIIGLSLASTTMLVALELGLSSRTERSKSVLVSTDDVLPDPSPAALELAVATRAAAEEPTRVPAPPNELVEERLAAEGATHAFDVTFVTLDAVGRPVPWTSVEVALDGFRFNKLGTSDMKGRLNVKWSSSSDRFDGIVRCGRPTLGSHIHMLAGGPQTLRIPADVSRGDTYDPAQDMTQRMQAGSEIAGRGFGFAFTSSFEHEAAGRGEFVDTDLIARIPEPNERSRSGARGGGGCGFSVSHAVHIVGFVHDENGKPLRGIEYRAIKNHGMTVDGETGWEGKIVLDTAISSSIDIWIGGRDRALVCKTLDASASSTPWDVELPKVPLACGRLVDEHGAPLPYWTVEAHDARGNFVGATSTDRAGEFDLGVPDGEPVELRARSTQTMPACLVARQFAPDRPRETLVAVGRVTTISWWVELPFAVEGDAPEARLQRLDTGESVVVQLSDVEDREDGSTRYRFRSDEIITGEYVASNFAPGCVPAPAIAIRPAFKEQDFGRLGLALAHDVMLSGSDVGCTEPMWVRAIRRVRGHDVVSAPMSLPGKFALADGSYELEYRSERSSRASAIVRKLRVDGGERERLSIKID